MDFKIVGIIAVATVLFFSSQVNAKPEYSAEQYIKNYALSVCVAKGYNSKEVKDDASAAARGYLEFGDYSLAAHSAVRKLVDEFLAKTYSSQSGESMILAKCIDVYHSAELESIVKKYKGKEDG
ncbi:type VI secretion system amidase immunity protein Tai4 [Erwinia sp. PK3-005]